MAGETSLSEPADEPSVAWEGKFRPQTRILIALRTQKVPGLRSCPNSNCQLLRVLWGGGALQDPTDALGRKGFGIPRASILPVESVTLDGLCKFLRPKGKVWVLFLF